MKTLFIPLILLLTFSINSIAQEKSRQEKRGDKYAFAYNYEKAIKQYKKADELTVGGQRNLAESYSKTDQHILSADTYKVIVNRTSGVTAEDYYKYAMVQKSLGNYTEAAIWMNKFQQMVPNDLRAKSYMANKSNLNKLTAHNDKNKVERLEFNSDAQEFGPSFYQNNIAYTSSTRNTAAFKRTNNQNGKSYLDIYFGEKNGAQLNEGEKFDKHFRTKFHDGPVSFSNKDTQMAYTRNATHDRSKDKITELQIWFSSFVDEKWTKEEAFAYNSPEYSVGHPNLTEDGNTMYFVSDMPGGFGKADLYKTTKTEKGEWSKPVNMGNKINTEGDELFPFMDETNNVLFFTSNGHFGLGGMDVFIAPMDGDNAGVIVNPGAPVNTKHDDYAMIMDDNLQTGYFSSNRNGADDDIYSINFTEGINIGKRLEGIAMDKNGTALDDVLVKLMDENGVVIDSATTETEGVYAFFVADDKNFKLIGTNNKYNDGTNVANTKGDEYIVKANVTLLDKKVEEEVVKIPVEIYVDFGKAVVFKPIYFDFNKYDINDAAARELDKLVAVMNKNPDMIVELSSYTDCRADEDYNQTLSENRAQATLDYIKKRITNPERISGGGYGENATVNGCIGEGDLISDCTEDQHSKNRRTEFVVVIIKTTSSSNQ